jgi:hypothetical protein
VVFYIIPVRIIPVTAPIELVKLNCKSFLDITTPIYPVKSILVRFVTFRKAPIPKLT